MKYCLLYTTQFSGQPEIYFFKSLYDVIEKRKDIINDILENDIENEYKIDIEGVEYNKETFKIDELGIYETFHCDDDNYYNTVKIYNII